MTVYSQSECKPCKIEMSADGNGALLLGYRVMLTKSEYALLSLLLDADGALHVSKISENVGICLSSIAVHAANINKKVYPITKRRLIIGERGGEYRINEYI